MEEQTVVLQPKTTITSFEGIPWAIQKAVGGAIAALLFGDDKEQKNNSTNLRPREKTKKFLPC